VPFLYDTHALLFSEDAITLENELHKAFADRRVNHVNARREFFFATPAEVRELLVEKAGGLLGFMKSRRRLSTSSPADSGQASTPDRRLHVVRAGFGADREKPSYLPRGHSPVANALTGGGMTLGAARGSRHEPAPVGGRRWPFRAGASTAARGTTAAASPTELLHGFVRG
jgi:hypothetical protein